MATELNNVKELPDLSRELPSRRLQRVIAGCCLLAIMAASVVYGAYLLKAQFSDLDQTVRDELGALGDLKSREVARWRNDQERLGQSLQHAQGMALLTEKISSGPVSPQLLQPLVSWLESARTAGNFERAFFLDAQGKPLASAPADAVLDSALQSFARQEGPARKIVLSDLLQTTSGDRTFMGLLVPAPNGTGQLCLEINPQKSLLPMLQTLNSRVRSMEAFLVRKEETTVLFLSDPKLRPASAMMLRFPLTDPYMVESRAARGESGVFAGRDYRQEKVLASLNPVAGSTWFLVTKVDTKDVLGETQQRSWLLGGLLLVFMGCCVAGAYMLRNSQKTEFLKREFSAERERMILAERASALMRHSNDILVFTNRQWEILEMNERALQAYGYPAAKLRQMNLRDLQPPKARPDFERQMSKVALDAPIAMETQQLRADGSLFTIEMNLRLVDLGDTRYGLMVARDLTHSRLAGDEVKRLRRARALLGTLCRAGTQANSPTELLDRMCQLATTEGGYKLAWIGAFDAATRTVAVQAQAGEGQEALRGLKLSAEGPHPESKSPGVVAAREGRSVVANEIQFDLRNALRRETAGRMQLQSCAAFPIRSGTQVRYVLTLFSGEPQAFGEGEIALWEEICGHLATMIPPSAT